MKKFIGNIVDGNVTTDEQIKNVEERIRKMLHLNTVKVERIHSELLEVSTDDENIIDFNLSYPDKKLSLVKIKRFDDNMNSDNCGAIQVTKDIMCKEKK